nr:hypothetical protein [uncultured Draconibacterium sp.]
MKKITFHERQHINRLLQQQGSVKYIFDEFVKKTGYYLTQFVEPGNMSLWTRNKHIEKMLDSELKILHDKLVQNISDFTTDAWNRSHANTDEIIEAFIKDLPISKIVKEGMFARNAEGLQTFLKRKVDGLTFSERVWKLADGAKENIEFYLESGLATGRRADLISQDIRQLLQNPDRRFHRIRNKDGKLVPSAPMKDYNPGRGVYRSSYKNAMRLAVTNTNAMYRQTDCERWSQLDFIKGIKIQRSSSASEPCVICDPLAGKYPKDYVFKGWHPWCICYAVPILMDEDAFMDALNNDDFSGVDYIKDIPTESRVFFQKELEKKSVTLDSYLFKDNRKYFQNPLK